MTDRESATDISQSLGRLRWDVFRDEVSIAAGKTWPTEIDTHLEAADAMVCRPIG
jgi:hypothetical protein